MLWGDVTEDFYKGFAQRARELAEKTDPFTRRRLLDRRGDMTQEQIRHFRNRTTAVARARTTPLWPAFSGSSEA